MKIDHVVLGAYETNSYILRAGQASKDCLIIDTGLEAGPLVGFLQENKLNPVAVVLTHGHADHIVGVGALRANWPGIKICIHGLDEKMLTDSVENLGALAGCDFSTGQAERIIEDGDEIEYAGVKLKVLHTPGHTRGGICLYSEQDNVVFTGDTLFADSVGRTDFPYGDMEQLIAGIRAKLLVLSDETKAYPGHGPSTKIGREKRHNQFLV